MKLLFDQNISARLMTDLADLYPESKHVRNIGMASADDVEIWEYAREHCAVIVSKDSDFIIEACCSDTLQKWCGSRLAIAQQLRLRTF